jgi:hypothetical protein
VITLSAPLQTWSNEEGRSHFLVLPDEQSAEVRAHAMLVRRGFGSVKVEVTLQQITWQTSLFPRKSGGYFLPMKIGVLRKTGYSADDEVTVMLELL